MHCHWRQLGKNWRTYKIYEFKHFNVIYFLQVYDYFDKYTFICDMYDEDADVIRPLCLNFFPFDNSVQVIDTGRGRNLLKRVQLPSIKLPMLQIGNVVNIFSKLLLIKDCAPATLRTLFHHVERYLSVEIPQKNMRRIIFSRHLLVEDCIGRCLPLPLVGTQCVQHCCNFLYAPSSRCLSALSSLIFFCIRYQMLYMQPKYSRYSIIFQRLQMYFSFRLAYAQKPIIFRLTQVLTAYSFFEELLYRISCEPTPPYYHCEASINSAQHTLQLISM